MTHFNKASTTSNKGGTTFVANKKINNFHVRTDEFTKKTTYTKTVVLKITGHGFEVAPVYSLNRWHSPDRICTTQQIAQAGDIVVKSVFSSTPALANRHKKIGGKHEVVKDTTAASSTMLQVGFEYLDGRSYISKDTVLNYNLTSEIWQEIRAKHKTLYKWLDMDQAPDSYEGHSELPNGCGWDGRNTESDLFRRAAVADRLPHVGMTEFGYFDKFFKDGLLSSPNSSVKAIWANKSNDATLLDCKIKSGWVSVVINNPMVKPNRNIGLLVACITAKKNGPKGTKPQEVQKIIAPSLTEDNISTMFLKYYDVAEKDIPELVIQDTQVKDFGCVKETDAKELFGFVPDFLSVTYLVIVPCSDSTVTRWSESVSSYELSQFYKQFFNGIISLGKELNTVPFLGVICYRTQPKKH